METDVRRPTRAIKLVLLGIPVSARAEHHLCMREISNLVDLADADPIRWGAKAAVLGQLMGAGYNVPPGVVLEAASGDVSERELELLATLASTLDDVPLAVRSSSVNEDLADSSAAGRYRTVLGVRGPAAVKAAAREVLASADFAPMAVLVQQQVDATTAGVAFSANPVSGDTTEALVNAVRGLGDLLVSGDVTPDEWVVTGESARANGGEATAITAGQALEIAHLARRITADRGAPQDIEWAYAGARLFVLQARPITTLVEPVPIAVNPPAGFWLREDMHWSAPSTPLSHSILRTNAPMQRVCERYGTLITGRIETIGGWQYLATLPVGASTSPGKTPPAPPAWLMPVLLPIMLHLMPALRARYRAARRAEREDLPGKVMDRWRDEYAPAQRRRIAELRDVDLSGLSNLEFAGHLRACDGFVNRSLAIHYEVVMANFIGVAEFAEVCRELLDWDIDDALGLVVGTSPASSEPARALARIGQRVRRPDQVQDDLLEYRQTFGSRALSFDLAERTVAEIPGLVEQQFSAQSDSGQDADEDDLARRRDSFLERAHRRLRGEQRARFDRAVERGQRAYALRDDNALYMIDAPIALMRYAALEAGLRMLRAGAIASVDDIFYLRIEEVLDWFEGVSQRIDLEDAGASPDLRDRVRRRRGERAWALAHRGPATYGKHPGRPPSMRWLPRCVRVPAQALAFILGHVAQPDLSVRTEPDGAGELTGVAASAGTYTGPVKVVMSEADFGRVERGDVLVCPSTRPSWAILFPSLGAIITDVGGTLAHPAIVAREHRIPAVVGTGCATSVLRDGQIVTVDGAAGHVRYLPASAELASAVSAG